MYHCSSPSQAAILHTHPRSYSGQLASAPFHQPPPTPSQYHTEPDTVPKHICDSMIMLSITHMIMILLFAFVIMFFPPFFRICLGYFHWKADSDAQLFSEKRITSPAVLCSGDQPIKTDEEIVIEKLANIILSRAEVSPLLIMRRSLIIIVIIV